MSTDKKCPYPHCPHQEEEKTPAQILAETKLDLTKPRPPKPAPVPFCVNQIEWGKDGRAYIVISGLRRYRKDHIEEIIEEAFENNPATPDEY